MSQNKENKLFARCGVKEWALSGRKREKQSKKGRTRKRKSNIERGNVRGRERERQRERQADRNIYQQAVADFEILWKLRKSQFNDRSSVVTAEALLGIGIKYIYIEFIC